MKVVNFVTRQIQQSVEIVSPQALRGRTIESIAEGEDLDEDNDDDASNRYDTCFVNVYISMTRVIHTWLKN